MAELEVAEQRPAKANAIEHFGENVHAGHVNRQAWRRQRTIGHNIRTIGA